MFLAILLCCVEFSIVALIMFLVILRSCVEFSIMALHFFINDLRGKRQGGESTLILLLSGIALCIPYLSHPFIRVVSFGFFIIALGDTIRTLRTLHRMYFCCGCHQ